MAALVVCSAALVQAEDKQSRFGASVVNSVNGSGVIVTKVLDDMPSTKLVRVSDQQKLKLEAGRHAISHINGRHLTNSTEFVSEVGYSPKRMIVRVYDLKTTAWEDYTAELNGEPQARPVPQIVRQQPQVVWTQRQQTWQPRVRSSDRKKKRSFFNWTALPEGDDWRPGDRVWLFQKKPKDKGLRKAHSRQMTLEILTGLAEGAAAAADEFDGYQPSTIGRPAGGSSMRSYHQSQRDSFNRGFSTNPLFRSANSPFNPATD